MNKYKTYGRGWFNESHRHSLASRGIKSKISLSPVYIKRKSTRGMDMGDETDPVDRVLHRMPKIKEISALSLGDEHRRRWMESKPSKRLYQRVGRDSKKFFDKKLDVEGKYIQDQIDSDQGKHDITEITWTNPDDEIIGHYEFPLGPDFENVVEGLKNKRYVKKWRFK